VVASTQTFAQLTFARSHACALTSVGDAYCWGYGGDGQLGTGDRLNRLVPTPVSGGLRFADMASTGYSTCGATTTGQVACWGKNDWGATGQPVSFALQPIGGDVTFLTPATSAALRSHP